MGKHLLEHIGTSFYGNYGYVEERNLEEVFAIVSFV
jgi:hypothetical protein